MDGRKYEWNVKSDEDTLVPRAQARTDDVEDHFQPDFEETLLFNSTLFCRPAQQLSSWAAEQLDVQESSLERS